MLKSWEEMNQLFIVKYFFNLGLGLLVRDLGGV